MGFKRKRVYAPKRNAFKKRKSYSRKRVSRKGGSQQLGYTSLNTKDHQLGFRGRKTSRRAYIKNLWDSTKFSTHYRSYITGNTSLVTPSTVTSGQLQAYNLHAPTGPSSPFWTVAGGVVPTDAGVAVPLFKGNIILRGGQWECVFYNGSTTNDVKLKIWTLWTTPSPTLTTVTPVGVNWDPTTVADFTNVVGKILNSREVVIEQGNSYTIKGRFRIQKIDESAYGINGRSLLLYVLAYNIGSTTPVSIGVTVGYNLAFSADAIGST